MSNDTFASFKCAFKGDLVTPTDPDYTSAIARWARNAQMSAGVVAFVKNEEDVALALAYARRNKLQIAVRGGGFSTQGASSTDGGVVIDLSRYLNGVRVEPDNKLIFCGGGAIWETVDKAAIRHGLATVGSTVNQIGVGGFVLGGGLGWLTGTLGLAIDNLAQVTIVTADGTRRIANERESLDLFWGLRGGGGNFGVVTEFVLKLQPQRRTVYAGRLAFPASALRAITAYTAKWWNGRPSGNEGMIQVLGRGPDGRPGIFVFLFYNGSEGEGRARYKALFDLNPSADFTAEIPYEDLNGMITACTTDRRSTHIKGVVLPVTRYGPVMKAFDRLTQLNTRPDFDISISLEYIPLDKVLSIAPDATALNRRPDPNMFAVVRWDNDISEDVDYARAAADSLTDIIAKGNVEAKEADLLGPYVSDAEAEGLLPGDHDGYALSGMSEAYFGANYRGLQVLKKKYDPELTFNKCFVIDPA